MLRTVVATVVIALCGVAGLTAQTSLMGMKAVTTAASIQAMDTTARTVTLRDDKGNQDTYSLGPEVVRLNEMKVGDTIRVTYYESAIIQLHKPGEQPLRDAAQAAVNRGTAALPSGSVDVQERMTVTVKELDPVKSAITVSAPDGRTASRTVRDKAWLGGLKVGDQLDITYTRALISRVERVTPTAGQ